MNAFRVVSSFLAAPVLLIAAQTLMVQKAGGAVSYTTPGVTYTENFDGLPTDAPNNASLQGTGTGQYVNGWQDDTTTVAGDHISLLGWYLWHPIQPTGTEIGSNGHQRFRMGPGQNTGAFWGFGSAASATDKSLGSLGSTTIAADGANMYIGFRLVNNTGIALNSFTVKYDGEQWRDGQSASGETLSFGYSLTASTADWNGAASFTGVSGLNFTSPVVAGTGTSGTAVDGNNAGLVANITATITGIDWEPGTELWLRWADPQLGGGLADDGLSIDNFSFTATQAIPEPTSLSLFGGFGLLYLVLRRRK